MEIIAFLWGCYQCLSHTYIFSAVLCDIHSGVCVCAYKILEYNNIIFFMSCIKFDLRQSNLTIMCLSSEVKNGKYSI